MITSADSRQDRLGPELTIALLAENSPAFRRLALTRILGRSDDDEEVVELSRHIPSDPRISALVENKAETESIRRTAIELRRLARCGVGREHSAVRSRVEVIFARQNKDGSWPIADVRGATRVSSGSRKSPPDGTPPDGTPPDGTTGSSSRGAETETGYSMIPLQTAIPLHAIAASGYATDPRSEAAYEWLCENRNDDGSWPTGLSEGVFGRVAGYRRIAHSRWGCRSNTTGALLALSYHPTRRTSDEAYRALELVLGYRGLDTISFGFDLARVLGLEENGGTFTYFGRYDVAQILGICGRVSGSTGDERIRRLTEFADTFRERSGLFTHPVYPQLSRWLTLEMIISRRLIDESEWIGVDAITPPPRDPRRRY